MLFFLYLIWIFFFFFWFSILIEDSVSSKLSKFCFSIIGEFSIYLLLTNLGRFPESMLVSWISPKNIDSSLRSYIAACSIFSLDEYYSRSILLFWLNLFYFLSYYGNLIFLFGLWLKSNCQPYSTISS